MLGLDIESKGRARSSSVSAKQATGEGSIHMPSCLGTSFYEQLALTAAILARLLVT